MTIRSMFSGISGLKAQTNAIDTIGNNIANVNTIGFRRARITFSDVFSQTLSGAVGSTATRGGINPRQIGLGVKTDTIDTIFTQGNPQQTGRLLDLAIRGTGFFQLTDGTTGSAFFTRSGNFGLDEQGYITKPGSGLRLVGQIANPQGDIDYTIPPQAVKVDFNSLSAAIPTNTAVLGGNLSTTSQPTAATSLNTLVTLFNEDGLPLGLNAGDTIRITSGSYDTVPPTGVISFTTTDVLTVTPTTTLGDLANALTTALRRLTGSNTMDANVEADGTLRFDAGSETLSNLSISAFDIEGGEKTLFKTLFSDGGLDEDIDLTANSSINTRVFRQADATTSTEVFDSQGNARTVVTTFARDTRNVPAAADSLLTKMYDAYERNAGLTVGSQITILGGTVNGNAGAGTTVITIGANSTMEDLRAALQTALNTIGAVTDITVSLTPDGAFRINSPTANIANLQFGLDPDGAGPTAASIGTITRLLINKNQGVTSATDGLDVTAGVVTETNSFHQNTPLLNSWTYQVLVPHNVNNPPSATTGSLIFLANGTFQNYGPDSNGNIIRTNPVIEFDPDGADPNNGGVDAMTISFDFSGLSQNASASTAAILSQDGSPVGRLETIDITSDGTITGVFSNGTTRRLAQILIASFANEGGLLRRGDNLFVESSNSGDPVLGSPGTLARGIIQSNELELSNVDISEEFVNLILAQRAFQANARVISTGDTVLNELVNLIR